MGFSKQEYWSGLPFPPPGDLPNPGIQPASLISPALAGGFFTTSASWEACTICELLVVRLYELCRHFALFYILLLLFIYPQE